MIIGVPKEVKDHEYRPGLLPDHISKLTLAGHQVLVETGTGLGIDISDSDYTKHGAHIVNSADEIFTKAKLIVKVKEPTLTEANKLSKEQILFTFLHLAPIPEIATAIIKTKATAIGYETVTTTNGHLPILAPMSEIAGKVAVQIGAHYLEKINGGRGILLSGVTGGVAKAKVLIIGAGVVGSAATEIAVGMGADVTVLDKSSIQLERLVKQYGDKITVNLSKQDTIEKYLRVTDLIIGAVLVPGRSAPKIITKPMLKKMRKNTVIIDVAVDQGGCLETSKATTYTKPTFIAEGVIHYCVPNIPSATPITSALALSNASLPYILEIANKGLKSACTENRGLLSGVNICNGFIVHDGLSKSLKNLPYKNASTLLSN